MQAKGFDLVRFLYLLAFLGLVFVQTPAFAQGEPEKPQEHYVNFRVLAERSTIQPGAEIMVGVEQSIAPHWHTYWVNPGDSGSAPRLKWKLPERFEAGSIQWPVPRKIPYDVLLNYGYEDGVVLLQTIKAPASLPDGPVKLSVDVEVLVCKDICIPEYATLDLVLNDPQNADENNTPFFDQARAALPQSADWSADFKTKGDDFILRVEPPAGFAEGIKKDSLEFLPIEWGLVANAAPADVSQQENGDIIFTQKRDGRDIAGLESIKGLLAFEDMNGRRQAYEITAQSDQLAPAPVTAAAKETADTSLGVALVMALLGGLVLNLMPCVFPVLSLKALSLVKIAKKDVSLARLHGMFYTGGVMLTFLLIAGVLIALQAGGAQLGWGFQLQNALVVSLLAYLLFVIGLNLSGFFEFRNLCGNCGGKLASGDGLGASFFTGVLATLVATPCTAPFMGVAIGYALLQPAIVALVIFAALGLGLALPYLVLAFVPALQKRLPRPGAWMENFRQFLAFPMFAFAAWLVWVAAQQVDALALLGLMLGLVLIAFAIWVMARVPHKGLWRSIAVAAIIFSLAGAVFLLPRTQGPASLKVTEEGAFGEVFSPEALSAALASSDPVFVEMTAAWCITCKVNHATSLNIPSTKELFAARGVRYLVGDWTNADPVITQYLKSFGRNGVPIYVYYGKPGADGKRPEAVLLPQILTPAIVAKGIEG